MFLSRNRYPAWSLVVHLDGCVAGPNFQKFLDFSVGNRLVSFLLGGVSRDLAWKMEEYRFPSGFGEVSSGDDRKGRVFCALD